VDSTSEQATKFGMSQLDFHWSKQANLAYAPSSIYIRYLQLKLKPYKYKKKYTLKNFCSQS